MTAEPCLRVLLYVRVSTEDQSYDRQISDLKAYCASRGYEVVDTYKDVKSGVKVRKGREACLKYALEHSDVGAIVVTELSRWGRSTIDLLTTTQELAAAGVSLKAQTGLELDVSTPQGKMILGILASIAEFERDLLSERTKSGMREARAKGKQIGRPVGFCPSDKHAPVVMAVVNAGGSLREACRVTGLPLVTVRGIISRHSA